MTSVSQLERVVEELRPRLSGRLHQVTAPLAALAALVQVVAAPTAAGRAACAVFGLGAALMLPALSARELLVLVWAGALLGAAFQLGWSDAPRWLYVPIYVALGWAAAFWAGDLLAAGEPLVLALIVVGGLLYTAGALVYGLRRPDPAPAWFGFHEVLHALTVAAFLTHYAGVWLLLT